MSDSNEVIVARMQERMTLLQASSERAHVRIDTIQKEIKDELKELHRDIKILLENMNRQQGSKATWVWIAGLSVALVAALSKIIFH